MSFEIKMRYRTIIILLLAMMIGIPLIFPVVVSPWTTINLKRQDINIKTGQARFTRFIWFIPVSQRIEDTALSKALNGKRIDVADIDEWHRVNSLSPGVPNSPHYIFHGAIGQTHVLGQLFELKTFSDTEKAKVAEEILIQWQTNGSYFAAGAYINDLLTKQNNEFN